MKINKMKYLFLAAFTLHGLAACPNSTTKSSDEKSDQNELQNHNRSMVRLGRRVP